ncbi:MAG: hypothetical protein ABIY70_24680, partial [Capsulimonas sp.]|uniref:hypothetical protein n=1 Tax=Capsulimonas sp. TaxID=2494211 RepID=UPI003264BF06
GGLMTVFSNIALMGIAFLAILTIKEHAFNLDVLKGILMIFFQLMIVGALALFFSVFLSPFVNFFLTFAIYLLGSLSSITESLAKDPDHHKNALVTGFFYLVHVVIPNFANYNIQNPIIHPEIHVGKEGLYIVQLIVYAILYTTILLTLAVAIFERREV